MSSLLHDKATESRGESEKIQLDHPRYKYVKHVCLHCDKATESRRESEKIQLDHPRYKYVKHVCLHCDKATEARREREKIQLDHPCYKYVKSCVSSWLQNYRSQEGKREKTTRPSLF